MLAQTAVSGSAGVAVVLVPAQDPAPPPGKGPEFGNASPVGLVVVLVLLVVTVFLIRSMTKRIRRLPESFDTDASDPDATAGSGGPDAAPSGPTVSDDAPTSERTDRSERG